MTDSSTQSGRPAFTDRDPLMPGGGLSASAEQEFQYRSVSRLAVFAFLLGLISPLALVHPLAWAIPFATIPIAWAAIRRIAKPHSMLSGKTIAILGLLIAVLLAAWAPTRHVVQTRLATKQAQSFADTWLQLVRDNHLQEAHRWMLPAHRRMPGLATQQFYETNVDLKDSLKTQFTEEPANLIASQSNSTLRFQGLDSMQKVPANGGTIFLLKYVLERDEEDLEDVNFIVSVRQQTEDNVKHWQISEIFKR